MKGRSQERGRGRTCDEFLGCHGLSITLVAGEILVDELAESIVAGLRGKECIGQYGISKRYVEGDARKKRMIENECIM